MTESGKRLLKNHRGGCDYADEETVGGFIAEIEKEAATAERDRIIKLIRDNAEEWDTTYSAEQGISLEYLLAALEGTP